MSLINSRPSQVRVRSRAAAATAIAVAATSAVVLPGTAVAQSTTLPNTTVTAPAVTETPMVTAPPTTVTANVPPVTATGAAGGDGMTILMPSVPAADGYKLEWPSQPVRAGRATTAALDPKLIAALPSGTTFTTDYPGATVDDDGRVTFAPGVGAPTGATLVPVTATFADGSAKEYTVRFDVAEAYLSDRFEPTYPKGKGAVTDRVAVIDLAPGPQLPDSTRFLLQEGDLKGWKVAVDKLTGRVSALAPANAAPIAPTVWVSYGDGSDDYITVPIGVLDEANAESKAEITFDVTPAKAGESTVVKPAGAVPAGATFEIAPGSTDIVRSINPATGEMIVDLPAGAQAGSTYAVTYRVHFADGSSKDETVSIPVRSQASEQTVGIPAVQVTPGGRATSSTATAPEGTTFALADTFAVDGWSATVDAATGRVAVSAPANATAGTSVTIPVVVSFTDGSQKLVTVSANVIVAPAPIVATTPASAGSAEGKGWLWIVLGTLAALGGIGFAATLNQQWIREQAAQFGIRF